MYRLAGSWAGLSRLAPAVLRLSPRPRPLVPLGHLGPRLLSTSPAALCAPTAGAGGGSGAAEVFKELDFVMPVRPVPLEELTAVVGEPGLDTLGLAGWWPPGRIQQLMEWMHIDLGLEWWQTILVTTICMRIIVFPVVIKAQKNMALMNNNAPMMTALQEKFTAARARGDMMEAARLGGKIQEMNTKEGVNPLKSAIPVFMQLPIFMSMFFALRGMANCPVESMKTGGLYWFADLTVADPYFVLPVLTSVTLFIQFKIGAEYGTKLSQMSPLVKGFMTAFPCLLLAFTHSFPAALTLYWCGTNFLSVLQARLLRVPRLRKAFNIAELVQHEKPKQTGGKKKGFVESIRQSMDSAQVMSKLDFMKKRSDHGRDYDERMFRQAAGKRPRTFKYDPTKPVEIKLKDGKRVH